MKHYLLLLGTCLVLFFVSCKPGDKEATEEPKTDTVAVAVPTPVPMAIDSAAVAAKYSDEHAKAPSQHQNPYKTEGTKKAKVDAEPVIATYGGDETVKENKDEMGYYYYPTKWASFPGGEAALDKFMADNLKYPKDALDRGIEGTVYVDLHVDETGTVVDAKIISKKIGFGLEEEVLRVIKLMPRWDPGEWEAHTVKTIFTLPVVFDLR